PGKVNINTIFDSEIWDSVIGQFPGLRTADLFANQLFLSRQGHFGSNTLLAANPSYPTWFANPVRAADSADLMPAVPPVNLPNPSMRKMVPVEATLLRPDPTYQQLYQPTGQHQPLFQINQGNNQYINWVGAPPGSTYPPLGQPQYVGQYHDTTRNPYFAY